jgi:hypothetical protein
MRKLSVLTLSLALLACGALTMATGASALEWLVGAAPIMEGINVGIVSEGTLMFDDETDASLFECALLDKGTVASGGKGSITSITSPTEVVAAPCKLLNAGTHKCEEPTHVTALNLPWTTRLIEVGGVGRNRFTVTGGEPGWELDCLVFGGIKLVDTCTAKEPNVGLKNLATTVEQIFDTKTEKWKCTSGDTVSISGKEIVKTTGGAALQVS